MLGAADLASLHAIEQLDYLPFDPRVKRTEATLRGSDGDVFKITKGAPDILLKLMPKSGGLAAAVAIEVERAVEELALRGIRSLAVARSCGYNGEWEMLGMLTFLDPPRPDTADTLRRAKEYGVEVKMVTGDHKAIARETCRQLGLGDVILGPDGLPSLTEDGRAPDDLANYAPLILGADGFAQARDFSFFFLGGGGFFLILPIPPRCTPSTSF